VAQVTEHLPCKHKALSLDSVLPKQQQQQKPNKEKEIKTK
jgi:hypothetical protein